MGGNAGWIGSDILQLLWEGRVQDAVQILWLIVHYLRPSEMKWSHLCLVWFAIWPGNKEMDYQMELLRLKGHPLSWDRRGQQNQ